MQGNLIEIIIVHMQIQGFSTFKLFACNVLFQPLQRLEIVLYWQCTAKQLSDKGHWTSSCLIFLLFKNWTNHISHLLNGYFYQLYFTDSITESTYQRQFAQDLRISCSSGCFPDWIWNDSIKNSICNFIEVWYIMFMAHQTMFKLAISLCACTWQGFLVTTTHFIAKFS